MPFVRNCLVPDAHPGDAAFWAKVGGQGVSLGNSMFLCTADGKVVPGFQDKFIGLWLGNWQKMSDAERRPGAVKLEERGEYKESPRNPKAIAGGLFIKTYMRALDKDAKGELFAPEKLSLGISKTVVKAEPNRDFLWIKAEEWQAMVPAQPKKGDTFPMPAAISQRMFRFHILDGACCLPGYRKTTDIQAGELSLTVEEVTASELKLGLRGAARLGAKTPYEEYDIAGTLVYDLAGKALTRFDAVALARAAAHKDAASGKLLWLGVAFELGSAARPADCRVPYRIWYDDAGFNDYFGG